MPPKQGMVAVMHYFQIPTNEFRGEWARLTEADKADLKSGIGSYDPDTHEHSGLLAY